ncbi:MAG TPA: phosphatase PAP2 family protein [Sporichthya sp.]|nr:phosphatase PAP2 family protein [Sporichthya sp.]
MSLTGRVALRAPGAVVPRPRARVVVREALLVGGGVLLYFLVRGLTVGDEGVAVAHAHEVARWEQSVGLGVEPDVQNAVGRHDTLVDVMNWVYIWGHWPVIAASLIWLVLRHPAGYRVTRNAMLFSGSIGLIIFTTYPLAPPRLASLGLRDTVTERSSAYRVLQPKALVNQYAAMPSLHVGWDLLIGVALFAYAGHVVFRLIGVVLPVAMSVAVVATANHYVIDALVGIAIVLPCLALAVHLERARPRPAHHPGLPRPRRAT